MSAFCASQWLAIGRCATVSAAVKSATKLLKNAGVPEASAGAEHLAVASFSCITTRHCARTSAQQVNLDELQRFSSLCMQRATKRTPVQYLVGDWDFHNVTLKVRSPVLIPRPETEELVNHVLSDQELPRTSRVLDIGCGSGAILLALLADRSEWTGVGADISPHAVALSTENADWLGLSSRARFFRERASNLSLMSLSCDCQFDVVVSNPPYIPAADMALLEPEVSAHEDFSALCGGQSGLDVVDEVLTASQTLLKKGGCVWLEVDESHPELLAARIYPELSFLASYNDMYGRPRFCQFVKTKTFVHGIHCVAALSCRL